MTASRYFLFIFALSAVAVLLFFSLGIIQEESFVPNKIIASMFESFPSLTINSSSLFPSALEIPSNFFFKNPWMEISTAATTLEPPKPIIVLAYSNLHAGVPWTHIDPPLFKNCPTDLNCIVTHDRKLFNESSAVIFHLTTPNWWDPTPARRSDQYFVFALWESPTHGSSGFQTRPDYFNLTMSYRTDSDIFWPYGMMVKKRVTVEEKQYALQLPKKTKLLAWMVSVCRTSSARESYVAELRKHIPVDTYGGCGPLKCPKDPRRNPTALGVKSSKPCDAILANYKFYLSFENSLCRDYVTEKFFERMDNVLIVPVVMERNIITNLIHDDEKDRKVFRALNRSFIAADDFDHPKKLAEYLQYLDSNETAYLEYFEWRREYEIQFEEQFRPGCQLCRIIRERKEHRVMDIRKWWIPDAQCHRFNQADFSN